MLRETQDTREMTRHWRKKEPVWTVWTSHLQLFTWAQRNISKLLRCLQVCVQLINTSNMLHHFTREHVWRHQCWRQCLPYHTLHHTSFQGNPRPWIFQVRWQRQVIITEYDWTASWNKPCEPRAWREVGSTPEMDRYGCACYCCQRC